MKSIYGSVGNGMTDATCVFYRPLVREWGIYFKIEDGFLNRLMIMKDFLDFRRDFSKKRLVIDGKCRLGGRVLGHEMFNDNDCILTSAVKTIEIVERNGEYGTSHDLLCVTTSSDHMYYVYSNDYNAYMAFLLHDMIRYGKLKEEPNYYFGYFYCNKDLL